MPQYTYGSGQGNGPSTTDLARRITELQNEVTVLKAERTQWRATLKNAVATEVEEVVASTTSAAAASESWRRSIEMKSNVGGAAPPTAASLDLRQLEERLAKRISAIAQRVGTLPEQQGSPASGRGYGPGRVAYAAGPRRIANTDAMLMSDSNAGGHRMPRISPLAGGVVGGADGAVGADTAFDPEEDHRRQSSAVHLLRQFHGGHQSTPRQLNASTAPGGLNLSSIPADDDDRRKPSLAARLVRQQQAGSAASPRTGPDHVSSSSGGGGKGADASPRQKPPLGAHGSMRGIAQATRAAIAMGGTSTDRPVDADAPSAARTATVPSEAAVLSESVLKQQPSSAMDLDRMRRDLAKASTTKARTDGRRGLSERHPFIAALDVLFVITSTVVCMLAISITHGEGRKKDFAEGTVVFTTAVAAIIAIEVFTCGWMASRLFVSLRKGDWEIIDDLPGIRSQYLRTWFGFDLLYSIPLEVVFVTWQWDALRWFALRHFLRVPRMIKLGGSFNPLLSSRLWFRFLSVVLLLVLGVSILAAIFWGLEPRYSFEESLYWAIATVTSVGYGDVVPDDQTSRIFVCFAMFAGIVAISIITAFATSFLSESDKLKAEEDTRKQMMYAMLEHYDVPWEVQKEVIGAMPTMLDDFNKASFTEMTAHLPTFVGQKVTDYVQAKVLMQQAIFKRVADAEPKHLLTLSRFVHQDVYAPDTVIAEEGSPADTLFFIVRGQVRLLMISFDDPDDEDGDGDCEAELVDMGTVRAGETFGEFHLEEGGEGPAPRSMSAVSETVVNVLFLNRDSLNELQTADPSAHAALLQSLATNATTEETTFDNFVRF